MELRQGSRVQPGTWGRGYSTSTRVYWFTPSQEFGMDETQTNEGAPRETEREPRTSDSILLERLRTRRDRTYDRILDIRRHCINIDPSLAESISSIIRLSVIMGRTEERLLSLHTIENAEETSPDEDERDD